MATRIRDIFSSPDLATKYGYPLEAHRVITDDGYILEMHRIPYGRYENQHSIKNDRTPIILQHGLAGSSADWVIPGPERALAYILADEGYDVWLGNNRGNIYSRHHRHMQPDNLYDLPAMIDHVLAITFKPKLLFVGHSQGTTQFFVMTSMKPEYNSKVGLAVCLAPAAYTGHLRGPVTQLAKLTYFGVVSCLDHLQIWVGENFGYPEFRARSMWSKFVSSFLCHNDAPTQFLCTNALFLVAGFSKKELNMNNLTVIIGHVPAGASWKQVVHFGQGYMNPGHFRAYDYGENKEKNFKLYQSVTPPEYQLERITTPIALFSSDNDWLATTEDVSMLKSRLNNIIVDYKAPFNSFNHYDFLWGNSAVRVLYPVLLDLLSRYR
ncbi:hypothetical protein PV328_010011 [Microctonus aethiopoides]|uniref:Lipase n=1 Tax=Microctonus aethiopoides TaxID=144406 RepID=A0AA39C710_9HYME|nr:hypothetical protein PV328_010011 [Microctonus aethiopoides]